MVFSARMITYICLLASPIGFLMGAPLVASGPVERADCSTAALNGVIEIGCWGYKECVDGIIVTHECPISHEFDRETMECVVISKNQTDCHRPFSCAGKRDGLYPDRVHSCQTYVTCLAGYNMGRQYCPANLVFNETIQTCDYIEDTEPPCGTKVSIKNSHHSH